MRDYRLGHQEIGLFKLVSERIGSGIRRVEAFTGQEAYRAVAADRDRLERMSQILHATESTLEQKLEELLEENRALQKANQQLRQQLAGFTVKDLLSRVEKVEGIKVLSAAVEAEDMESLRMLIDRIKERISGAVIVLGRHQGKVLLVSSTGDVVAVGALSPSPPGWRAVAAGQNGTAVRT